MEDAENKNNRVYRDLTEGEEKALFSFYDKHNGNVLEMTKDKDIPFKSKNQIYYYRDEYDFISKLGKIREDRANKFKKEWDKKLKEGKSNAINRAIWLLETRKKTVTTKEGESLEITIEPDNKDIKTAYEILKIELGEPTNISKNTNVDETEVEKALNILKNGIKENNKTISDRQQTGETIEDSTKNIRDNSKEKSQKSDNDTSDPIRKKFDSGSGSDNQSSSI